MAGILAVDFVLLTPYLVMDPVGDATTGGAIALLVILAVWKVLMLVVGVFLAIRCRVVSVRKYEHTAFVCLVVWLFG